LKKINVATITDLIFNRSRRRFGWLYLRGRTPWDTNVTPPEVMEFIASHPPGKALDLGCGTGTNAITLARHGWQVTAIDFVGQAIRRARIKAAAAGLRIDFKRASVTEPIDLAGPYDYALDIGCLFGLTPDERVKYLAHLVPLLRKGAWYMLYAWMPRQWKGRAVGLTIEQVEELLQSDFAIERIAVGEEKGFASAWYWYLRK
jgi:2-polyprenyl-3-methyl-5-hydroxy-6-metoxy-1,4-benzoquinol methylase